jgi:hypothetical protein
MNQRALTIMAGIPPAEQQRLAADMGRLAAEAHRSMRSVIPQLLRFAVQSARTVTTIAKRRKLRNIERMGKRARKAAGIPGAWWWAKYLVAVVHNGQGHNVPAADRAQAMQRRVPELRGLAKAAWSRALAKLPQTRGEGADAGGRVGATADRASAASYVATRDAVTASATNALRYMAKIAPNAAELGAQAAMRRMAGMLNARVAQLNARRIT